MSIDLEGGGGGGGGCRFMSVGVMSIDLGGGGGGGGLQVYVHRLGGRWVGGG